MVVIAKGLEMKNIRQLNSTVVNSKALTLKTFNLQRIIFVRYSVECLWYLDFSVLVLPLGVGPPT